jgi:hypothetical protein
MLNRQTEEMLVGSSHRWSEPAATSNRFLIGAGAMCGDDNMRPLLPSSSIAVFLKLAREGRELGAQHPYLMTFDFYNTSYLESDTD